MTKPTRSLGTKTSLLSNADVASALRSPMPRECIDGVEISIPILGRRRRRNPYSDDSAGVADTYADERSDAYAHAMEHVSKKVVRRPGKPGEQTTYQTSFDLRDDFTLRVREAHYGRNRSLVTFFCPRPLLPEGQTLAALADIFTILGNDIWPALLDEYVIHVAPNDPAVRLTRLDITRDIPGIARPGHVLEGLRSLPQHASLTKSATFAPRLKDEYCDPTSGATQTCRLQIGSDRRGHLTVYDKSAQDPTAPLNTLRFEMQSFEEQLKRVGIQQLLDITAESISLLEEIWGLPRFADLVASTSHQRIDKITARLGTGEALVEYVGVLAAEALGVKPTVSAACRKRIGEVRRATNIATLAELFEPSDQPLPIRIIPGSR